MTTVSFQHANPRHGRESILLRFDGLLANQTACVLIDAGANVDVTQLLDENDNEHLAAICLTHAHLDHFQSLGNNLVDGAPIYASPGTTRILEDVLETGEQHYDLTNTTDVVEAIEPNDEWTRIVPGLRVHPIPAGHTAGAAGFLFDVEDRDERRTILVTGDWTTRRAAGYPGFSTDLPFGVDVVVLAAATNDTYDETLTDCIGTIVERARAGSTVLVTASGLTSLHLAYLLGNLPTEQLAIDPLCVTVAGHAAALYDDLEYDVPGVTSVPEFTDPESLLNPGNVTIAGPEVPVDGSAEQLFNVISADPGATLVQVLSGATTPTSEGSCTSLEFTLSNHPAPQTIDDVVEALSPIHVVITHQQGRAAEQYKDKYESYVWATDDQDRYTLLDDSGWRGPPWVTQLTDQRVRSNTTDRTIEAALTNLDIAPPSIQRHQTPDLDAEGLRLDSLASSLGAPETLTMSAGSNEKQSSSDSVSAQNRPVRREVEPTASLENGEFAATGTVEGEEAPEGIDAGLAALERRLEAIERAVSGERVPATVVDAGDGVCLLRLSEPPADLEHGQEVSVTITPGGVFDDQG